MLLFPISALCDKEGFSVGVFLMSIYNNSSNNCTLTSKTFLSGHLFQNNRVPEYIPAGNTLHFIMLAKPKRTATVRLSYECGAGNSITFISRGNRAVKPPTKGVVENSQNMRAYYNTIFGVNTHSIDWILEVTA